MIEEQISTEDKILLAAIESIEAFGIDKVTTRRIADTAGTNVASINYYFRSKEELIERALTQTINHMMEDVFLELDKTDRPLREALVEVFFYLIDGGRRYPGLTTAHLYSAVVEAEYDTPGAQAMQNVFERLTSRAVEALSDASEQVVRFVLSQLIGSIMFMLLAPGFFEINASFKPVDSTRSRALAEYLTDQFFAGLDNS